MNETTSDGFTGFIAAYKEPARRPSHQTSVGLLERGLRSAALQISVEKRIRPEGISQLISHVQTSEPVFGGFVLFVARKTFVKMHEEVMEAKKGLRRTKSPLLMKQLCVLKMLSDYL